jgi:CIC family chloride channel protein
MKPDEHSQSLLTLSLLAILIGIMGGIASWGFRMLIGLIHNFLFLGEFSPYYDANVHTAASPWGAWIILAPMLGALVVAWLVKNFAPEAKGHGVPEVIYSIHYEGGKIRPVVAIVKSLASSISIGSGGSVGREGPIIQIGAAFASAVAQWVTLPVHQRVTLVAAGAAAGIAATFNAPLGGIVFAVELLLVSISATTLLPVALAVVVATHTGRFLLGMTPAFDIPALQMPTFEQVPFGELMIFIPFGLLMGVVSAFFVRGIYWAEDRFDSMPGNYYTRHVTGMFFVGVIFYLFQHFSGHYYVQGVGYATITDLLNGTLGNPWFLLLLFAAKMLATFLTLGSGASGGVFSPAFFLGGTLGAAIGQFAQMLFPELSIEPAAFALAGMVAMVGSATGAVITATVMTFEMTRDYNAILPIILSAVTAYAVRKRLSAESIYTLKLIRRGQPVPEGLQAAIDVARQVRDVMTPQFRVVHDGDTVPASPQIGLQLQDNRIQGVIPPQVTLPTDASPQPYVVVSPNEGLVEAMHRMNLAEVDYALVSDSAEPDSVESIIGILSADDIARASRKTADLLR